MSQALRPGYLSGRPTLDARQNYQGFCSEWFDWMKTGSGANTAFKLGYHAVDWWKIGAETSVWRDYISNEPLPAEALRLGGALRDGKNLFGLISLPEKIHKFGGSFFALMEGPRAGTNDSYLRLGYQMSLNAAGVASPLADSADFLNSRVMAVAPETLKCLKNFSAGALLYSMLDGAWNDIGRIWVALKVLSPTVWNVENVVRRTFGQDEVESLMINPRVGDPDLTVRNFRNLGRNTPIHLNHAAMMTLELNLIDLAKCVSYIALAAISLISTFLVAIPHASFWILVASTSALAFTIFGEFAQRSERILNPDPKRELPDLQRPYRRNNREDELVEILPGGILARSGRGPRHGILLDDSPDGAFAPPQQNDSVVDDDLLADGEAGE